MSMHQIEDFIETSIQAVAFSQLSKQEKRNIIHTLFEMESYGDCSFTNLRSLDLLVDCGYTFLFDTEQIPEQSNSQEDSYFDDESKKHCVDSGSETWQEMVRIGTITGEQAIPVEILPHIEVLKILGTLVKEMDGYTKEGFYALALITGAFDDMTDEDCIIAFGISKEQAERVMDGEEIENEKNTASKKQILSILEQPCEFHLQTGEDKDGNLMLEKIYGEVPALKIFEQDVPFYAEIILGFQIPVIASKEWEIMNVFPLDFLINEINNQLILINNSGYIDQVASQYAAARGLNTNSKPIISKVWCEYTFSNIGTQCDIFIRIESSEKAYSFDLRLRTANEIVRQE